MIPTQLHMESNGRETDKDQQRDHFLNHLQLHQRERSSIAFKTDSVGRHLQAVFEKRDTPGQQDHKDQRGGIGKETGTLQLQVPVPGKRHEYIRRQ